jgi:hypothetical protein
MIAENHCETRRAAFNVAHLPENGHSAPGEKLCDDLSDVATSNHIHLQNFSILPASNRSLIFEKLAH